LRFMGEKEDHFCPVEKRYFSGSGRLPVEVEAGLSPGNSKFITMGLSDAAVRESQDRVRAALRNSGYQFPRQRITINLI